MSDPVFGLPSRRSFLTLSGIAVGGLALAACSGGATSTNTAGTGSSATEKKGIGNNGQVGKGRAGATADSLLIAGFQWGAPATFNPLSPTAAWPASGNVMQIVYESLLRWNILTGEIMPGLAKEYKVDGTNSVTLTLQDGITFSDGSPCTAKDVVATYELGKKNKGISISAFWQLADSIEATDDKTVVIKVNQKSKNVGQVLRTVTETYILPAAVFSAIADDKLPTTVIDKPIGTGPFTLSKADQTQVVLAINENYWGKTFYGGLPVMKQIIHPIFKSNEDGNIKFQAGELDIMQQFVSQIWKMWEGGKPVGTFLKSKPYFVPGSMPMLLMNTTKKGLDNAAVRKAIASAIDYASIADTAMSGYSDAVQASLILPTGAEGKFFNKSDAEANGWKYDAAAAEKILTDAGATKGSDGIYTIDGNRLGPYKLITPTGWTDWNAACEIVAKSLKAIGIDCATNFPQQADCTQAIQGGTFDLACWYVSGVNPATPWARFKDIMSQAEMQPIGKTTFANYGRWENAEVEAMLTEAAQATDDAGKKAAYDKLDALYRKEVPSCPLMYRPDEFYEYNASNFFNWPDENNDYAPPMFRGAGNTWMYKIQKIAG
ncbi:ABC transporter substrate-binding protein [Micropruina glycogenica]|uniref:ABC-type dipeptide transport system, periplasmic component n=1 Tax=Micropruina glycogenica TaxID=75385 RepID=A0A2N9JG70_9ACTN|nr:ABC transporter substrate-binding protein [Micropruina glycogenica]SPD86376.1 ABC-type dipeptide transport system, periplasmic component [Micropruina glycogenica]